MSGQLNLDVGDPNDDEENELDDLFGDRGSKGNDVVLVQFGGGGFGGKRVSVTYLPDRHTFMQAGQIVCAWTFALIGGCVACWLRAPD